MLGFNGISTLSISQLLNAITSTIASSQLAVFSLTIISKDNNYKDVLFNFEEIFRMFTKVPKIFFTHINSDSRISPVLPKLSLNSIGITVKSPDVSPVLNTYFETIKTSLEKPVTECFEEMNGKFNSLNTLHAETFDQKNVFPTHLLAFYFKVSYTLMIN